MTTPLDVFHHLDATHQAELVATGEASARELTEAAIERIERIEPAVNALVSTRFERALAEADAIDGQAKDERGPFAGVPFLVKDLDTLGGERLTMGSRLFRDHRPAKDDDLISTLRKCGLVALGKTTTPEFGLVNTTESKLQGPTRNPWGAELSPGGSSGGSAVAVATGMVPVATASDGGGSIRIPANANGIFGLKPSSGRGIMPPRNLPGDAAVTFAYGSSVRDTARLLQIVDDGRVAKAGGSSAPAIGFVGPANLKPLRIALVLPAMSGDSPEPEVERAVREAATLLESLGHRVEEAASPVDGVALIDHFMRVWASIPGELTRSFFLFRAVICGWRFWTWPAYEEALEQFTRDMGEFFRAEERANPGQVERAMAFKAEGEAAFAAFFRSYDLMLGPVLRRPWFALGELDTVGKSFDDLRESMLDNVGYTPIQNFLALPAMSVPLGTSDRGTPIGVHMTAPHMNEARLLKLAYQLEAAAPWADRRPPLPG